MVLFGLKEKTGEKAQKTEKRKSFSENSGQIFYSFRTGVPLTLKPGTGIYCRCQACPPPGGAPKQKNGRSSGK